MTFLRPCGIVSPPTSWRRFDGERLARSRRGPADVAAGERSAPARGRGLARVCRRTDRTGAGRARRVRASDRVSPLAGLARIPEPELALDDRAHPAFGASPGVGAAVYDAART